MRLPGFVLLIASSAAAFGAVGGGNGVAAGGNGMNGNNGYNYDQPNPADVQGEKYDVVFIPDSDTTMGGVKASSMLFRAKVLECDYLALWNITELPYTRQLKDANTVTFTATIADAAGNSLLMSGTATQSGAITGTLTLHKASGNQTLNYTFHGGMPGSPEAAQAAKDAESRAR